MSKYYCVKLIKDSYSCVVLSKYLTSLIYHKTLTFDTFDELSTFLKSKNNVSLSLFQSNFIHTSIEVQKTITSNSIINNLIKDKLTKDQIDINSICFSFNQVVEKKKQEIAKYKIHGIYKNDPLYLKSLDLLSDKNCESLSLEVFSLYSTAKKLYTEKNFLSIYITNDSLTIVAGNKNNIFFLRSKYLSFNENLENNTKEEQSQHLIEEIVKNTLYVKEEIRDIEFDILTINGILFSDQKVFNSLSKQLKIEVVSLLPTIKEFGKFTPSNFNKYLIEIGMLYLEKRFNFMPISLRYKKEFNKILNLYIPFLMILVGYFGYQSYIKYKQYDSAKIKYDNLSNNIINKIPNISIDKNNISNINLFLNTLKNSDGFYIIEYMNSINNTIQKIKSYDINLELNFNLDNFNWSNKNTSIQIEEIKHFNKLINFNLFVHQLEKIKNDLKNDLIIKIKSNPKTLTIQIAFIFKWNKK